jgi:hypothetical protein
MPRYYFSLENGESISAGDDAENLADDQTACAIAAQSARELARNNKKLGAYRVVVRTGNNRLVCEVPLKNIR